MLEGNRQLLCVRTYVRACMRMSTPARMCHHWFPVKGTLWHQSPGLVAINPLPAFNPFSFVALQICTTNKCRIRHSSIPASSLSTRTERWVNVPRYIRTKIHVSKSHNFIWNVNKIPLYEMPYRPYVECEQNPTIWNVNKMTQYEMRIKSHNMKRDHNPTIWNASKLPQYETWINSHNMKRE